MLIQTEIVAGVVIIKISGPEPGKDYGLTATVDRLLDDGHRQFVVNIEHAGPLDSPALGDIVRAYSSASRRGGKLKIEGLNEHIRESLELTKLTRLFEASADPFFDPFSPRLRDGYWRAAAAAGSFDPSHRCHHHDHQGIALSVALMTPRNRRRT